MSEHVYNRVHSFKFDKSFGEAFFVCEVVGCPLNQVTECEDLVFIGPLGQFDLFELLNGKTCHCGNSFDINGVNI